MPRYLLILEYDGAAFSGFQAQADQPSVQGCLEAAVYAFSGDRTRIHVAGRTDAGVHATGQAAHADLSRTWACSVVRDALNAHLVPAPVCILSAEIVEPPFHARFSAVGRRYLYRIVDRRAPAVLQRDRAFWVRTPLDAEAMHEAAQRLIGHHDFTTFRDARCQARSPWRTLDQVRVERAAAEVHIALSARSFLHRQVRSIAGSLVEVGAGRWSAEDLSDALEACERARCGPVAPAHGLYLTGVDYGGAAAVEDRAKDAPPPGEG